MTALTGMRLTLPDGQVYRISSDVDATMQQTWQYLFNGGQQALAMFEEYSAGGGQDGRGDGLKQSAALGAGAGRHVITIDAIQYVGSDDEWGDTDPGDSAVTKRDTLDHALNTVRISSDSGNLATLEVGEYSSGGKFDPLPVVMLETQLGVAATESASFVDVNLQMLEGADVQDIVHAAQQTED